MDGQFGCALHFHIVYRSFFRFMRGNTPGHNFATFRLQYSFILLLQFYLDNI